MRLVCIFGDNETAEGLYSICYGRDKPELTKLLANWTNPLFVSEYCEVNKLYLKTQYFRGMTMDQIINRILREAREFETLLMSYKRKFHESGTQLQQLFKPLHDSDYKQYPHQASKGLFYINDTKRPLLRIYAIRISHNAYVVSGGVIKITKSMEDHPDTITELQKIKKVKAFLIDNNFNTEEDLKIIL